MFLDLVILTPPYTLPLCLRCVSSAGSSSNSSSSSSRGGRRTRRPRSPTNPRWPPLDLQSHHSLLLLLLLLLLHVQIVAAVLMNTLYLMNCIGKFIPLKSIRKSSLILVLYSAERERERESKWTSEQLEYLKSP
jgi:hypothetical protein